MAHPPEVGNGCSIGVELSRGEALVCADFAHQHGERRTDPSHRNAASTHGREHRCFSQTDERDARRPSLGRERRNNGLTDRWSI